MYDPNRYTITDFITFEQNSGKIDEIDLDQPVEVDYNPQEVENTILQREEEVEAEINQINTSILLDSPTEDLTEKKKIMGKNYKLEAEDVEKFYDGVMYPYGTAKILNWFGVVFVVIIECLLGDRWINSYIFTVGMSFQSAYIDDTFHNNGPTLQLIYSKALISITMNMFWNVSLRFVVKLILNRYV